MKTKTKTRFEKMRSALPSCMIGSGADDARTEEDLIFACRIQLDLIEEGQDGTEEDDPRAIRRWLKKWDNLPT